MLKSSWIYRQIFCHVIVACEKNVGVYAHHYLYWIVIFGCPYALRKSVCRSTLSDPC